MRKKTLIWGLCTILVIVIFAILPVWGNQFQTGQTITISSDQVREDDLYLAGENITIDGTIRGDVVVAGRWITINGIIEGDVLAAGQTITIKGKVGDDLRLGAEVLKISENAEISDDAFVAGFSLETERKVYIGGNLNFFGAQALLTGKIAQNLKGVMGALELGGTVDKDVEVIVGQEQIKPPTFGRQSSSAIPELKPGLTLTDSAIIGGRLNYQSPRKATIAQGAQINGPIEYQPLEIVTQPSLTDIAIAQLRRLIALTLIAWLWFKFLPNWMPTLATIIQNRPASSLVWGIVTVLVVCASSLAILIGLLILVFLLALTLSNLIFPVLSLGLLTYFTLLTGLLIFTSYISPIAVSCLGGNWLVEKINSHQGAKPFRSTMVGLVVLSLLTAIPVLGGLLDLLIALLGLGALWLWGKKSGLLFQTG